ncbi:MAG: nuclear transport factor 2 family protein [Burkholderiaceae bacterium]
MDLTETQALLAAIASDHAPPADACVTIPIRVGGTADALEFAALVTRLAATPALGPLLASGRIRFDVVTGDADHAQEARNRALFERFSAAFQAGDLDALCECVSTDFEWRLPRGPEHPLGRRVVGHDGLRAAFAGERAEMMKRITATNEDVIVAGNRITQRYRLEGTLADGTRIDTYGLDLYTVRDGRIVAKDAYWKAFDPPPATASTAMATTTTDDDATPPDPRSARERERARRRAMMRGAAD